MLTDGGVVKVMDFGIARVSGTERMTNDGFMVGTPAYMAPEQVRGEDVDGRTDLYAVGVVFYRLLTGKLPFKADSAVAMIQSQLNDQPTPAKQVRAELPDWLDAVLMRALAKRPADRYQTAEEFRRALDALDELGALAPLPDDATVATPSAPARAVGVTPAAAATPAIAPSSTTTLVLNRSHLAVAAGFGVLLIIVIGLLALVALRRPASPVQVVAVPVPAPAAPAVPTATPSSAPAPAAPPSAQVPPPTSANAAPPAARPSVAEPPPAPPREATPPQRATGIAPAETLTPLPRGGRGRGARGGPPSADGEFKPMVIRDLHALVVLNGRGSRIVEAIVAFSEKSITATDSRSGFTVKTFSYAAVKHATVSRGRKPKGTGGVDVDTPGGIPEGNIFARGPRLWVTLETGNDRLVLRLDPPQLSPVLDLVAQRTKAPIERYMDPEKP